METGIYGWKARLGYAGPSPLSNIPYEFWKMAPDGIAMVSTGLHVSRQFDGEVTEIKREVIDAIRALDPFGLDCISIALAPLVYLHGSDSIGDDLRQQMAKLTTAPLFCDHEAVVEAIRHLKVRRLSVLSPYGAATNQGIATYFREVGFENSKIISHAAQSAPAEAGRLAASIAVEISSSNSEALYIAGDAWPVAQDIASIEVELGVPVITEAQSLLWFLLQRLHIRSPVANYGRLLAN